MLHQFPLEVNIYILEQLTPAELYYVLQVYKHEPSVVYAISYCWCSYQQKQAKSLSHELVDYLGHELLNKNGLKCFSTYPKKLAQLTRSLSNLQVQADQHKENARTNHNNMYTHIYGNPVTWGIGILKEFGQSNSPKSLAGQSIHLKGDLTDYYWALKDFASSVPAQYSQLGIRRLGTDM
ncbi:hypothetical protein PSN45_003932 [Yamadazyma tenuis]|uniref:uncharacterized protein n=1 Tax=Candida tenuis TaxID=2315449 RepID=UPI0027A6A843|nr:hypothetical protein PSN45_003932 [Yamadazyma tenuis]